MGQESGELLKNSGSWIQTLALQCVADIVLGPRISAGNFPCIPLDK